MLADEVDDAIGVGDVELKPRMLPRHFTQHRRHLAHSEGQRCGQTQAPNDAAAQLADRLARLVELGQNPFASQLELQPRLRRADAAGAAGEQVGAEIRFEAGDPAAQN